MGDWSKATPRPWRQEAMATTVWGDCDAGDPSSTGMGYPIVEIAHPQRWMRRGFPGPSERQANAALIIAAVNHHEELIAALQMVVDAYTDRTMGSVYGMERALPYAHAALARAKGE